MDSQLYVWFSDTDCKEKGVWFISTFSFVLAGALMGLQIKFKDVPMLKK